MLDLLPTTPAIKKIPAQFPNDPIFDQLKESFDYVLSYSVIQSVPDYSHFIHHASLLLKNQGRMLIGDIPNAEKKKRFLESQQGRIFHQKWSNSKEIPYISQEEINRSINDQKIIDLLKEYRSNGFEAYLLEQDANLPLAHTREDILIVRL